MIYLLSECRCCSAFGALGLRSFGELAQGGGQWARAVLSLSWDCVQSADCVQTVCRCLLVFVLVLVSVGVVARALVMLYSLALWARWCVANVARRHQSRRPRRRMACSSSSSSSFSSGHNTHTLWLSRLAQFRPSAAPIRGGDFLENFSETGALSGWPCEAIKFVNWCPASRRALQ